MWRRGVVAAAAAAAAAAGSVVAGVNWADQKQGAQHGPLAQVLERVVHTAFAETSLSTEVDDHGETEVVNWSGTHTAHPTRLLEPETLEEVEEVLRSAHNARQKLRVVGAAISPNGLGFSNEGMLSMAHCNAIVSVDPETKQVCVEAGARVSDVVEHLRPFGLTLQNYASISEQQIGGFVQAGAHGTGALIPPVDDQVVAFDLITPAQGTLHVTRESNPELFDVARVGLGVLGVMGRVTLQCIDAHQLVERTTVVTREEARRKHEQRLHNNKHVRYMWIPYQDAVVVVECNTVSSTATAAPATTPIDQDYALEPLRNLLLRVKPSTPQDRVQAMHFADLRDAILSANPLGARGEYTRACVRASVCMS